MKVTIIREDNWMSVDGRGIEVDLSDLPLDLHALQWDGAEGHIERQGLMNQPINSLQDFQVWIDRWVGAAYTLDNLPVPPPSVPQQVTRFQAQAALYIAGYLDDIEAYMALETTDFLTKLAWKTVLHFDRHSQMIVSVGALLRLTDGQLDDLFRFAATVQ